MNAIIDIIQRKVDELGAEAEHLQAELLSFGWPDTRPLETEERREFQDIRDLTWGTSVTTPATKQVAQAFVHRYHRWYASGLALIEANMESRVGEFRTLHEGDRRAKGSSQGIREFLEHDRMSFDQQIQISHNITHMSGILGSIPESLEGQLHNIELAVAQAYVNDELAEARILHKAGHIRASGAIAGVLLERHLKMLCDRHHPPIKFTKSSGISKLNDALKDAGVYDVVQWRRVQWMGDIRNQCDHANASDPRPQDVSDLVDDVKKFVSLFVI